jgi:hypothetical protein
MLHVFEAGGYEELIRLYQTTDMRKNHYLSSRKPTAALPKTAICDSANYL